MSDQFTRGDFRYLVTPCNVTGERDICLSVCLGEIEVTADDGTSDVGQIWGNFSREGLAIMQRALDAAPPPMDLPDPDGIRARLNYYWKAVYEDGSSVQQWPEDKNFSHLRPHEVACFYLLPKDPSLGTPAYCLDRERGFLRQARDGMDFIPLRDAATGFNLPLPTVPFHLEYCFRPQITFAAGGSYHETLPIQVRHEFGWRVDQCHGDAFDTWFILGTDDDDGTWQILRQEPANSRHFETDGDGSNPALLDDPDGPRRIDGNVRIIDAFSEVGAGV